MLYSTVIHRNEDKSKPRDLPDQGSKIPPELKAAQTVSKKAQAQERSSKTTPRVLQTTKVNFFYLSE
jgi:hypothetical protein